MKKISGILMAIIACCAMIGCNDSGPARKIGVVDINVLLKDSLPGKEGLKVIEKQQAALQAKLDALQDKLEKNPNNDQLLQELQKVYGESQQQIQLAGQGIVGNLFDAVQRAVNEFRQKNGYSMLVRAEALDAFDPALDVTQQIMVDVNKIKINFDDIEQALQATPMQQGAVETPSSAEKDAVKTPAPGK